MGMSGVSNLKARAALLVVGLLVTLLLLALSACGGAGGQEQAKGRPLPQDPQAALSPGEYHSVEFKPALSFEVGKGWENATEQLSEFINLGYEGGTGVNYLSFANVKEVFKPGTLEAVDAPDELVGWFQHHPYLKTSKPEPVTVGGVEGVKFDVLLVNQPMNHKGVCGDSGCLDIFKLSTGGSSEVFGLKREHYIVLGDVKG